MTLDIFQEYKEIPKHLIDEVKKEVADKRVTQQQLRKILDRTKKEYEEANINPGEAIGIITAESFGEPGTQMCVQKNEKVILKFKDRIKIMKIGEFVDDVFRRVKTRFVNNYETYNPSEELLVLGLDKDEKLKWSRVLALNKVRSPKKLIKLITKSGRSIIATDYHSFVTRKENQVVSIAGKDLNVGDRIPVMQYLPEHCSSSILINDHIQNVVEKNGILSRSKTKAKKIPNKLELDKLFGWFIGAYLAEGNAGYHQVQISNVNEDYISNARKFIEHIGLDYKESWSTRGFALGRDFRVSSSLLTEFIRATCSTGSSKKIVPQFAYSASDEFVSGLLRGYFDGDGNFHVKRKMIRVSSNSKELIDGIALLLSRFRIFSFKIKDHKNQHWLLIPYKYAPLFLQYIGSDLTNKRIALEELAILARNFWNETSQDYTDMISGFGNLFYNTAKKLGVRTRYINNFTKRQKIGRTALFRYIKKFEKSSKEKNIDITKELEIMNRMFNSDVIWDSIEKIEYVDSDSEYVYDLSIPGLETFTTAEGIVTHNTLNVKHFSGVAEVSVTLGLPRLIEIFDARGTPSTPSMEIYLKKEYSKDPARVRKIASQIKETKLEEVISEFSIDIVKMNIKAIIDRSKLRDIGMTEPTLYKLLAASLKNIQVKLGKGELTFKLKGTNSDLNELYTLKEKVKSAFIKGVKKITHVLPVKRKGEFIILTAGTNLKSVLQVSEVDNTRTVSNDIHEIYSVLGIEAARQAIVNEALHVIENQGLDIDIRHLMLISDAMTNKGVIKGITRGGITGEKESVLARASFETPIHHIMNAAFTGERDNLNSVIENVIINQEVPLGTGLPDLVAKMKNDEK